jgi:hypothetical protein
VFTLHQRQVNIISIVTIKFLAVQQRTIKILFIHTPNPAHKIIPSHLCTLYRISNRIYIASESRSWRFSPPPPLSSLLYIYILQGTPRLGTNIIIGLDIYLLLRGSRYDRSLRERRYIARRSGTLFSTIHEGGYIWIFGPRHASFMKHL